MEIEVGQKWARKSNGLIIEITNTVDFDDRIYYEYLFAEVHYIAPAEYLFTHFTLIPQFRPHWLLDDGTKIYTDETDSFCNSFWLIASNRHLYDIAKYCPSQCKNKECDFGILFNDGSHMWARWIGEEND